MRPSEGLGVAAASSPRRRRRRRVVAAAASTRLPQVQGDKNVLLGFHAYDILVAVGRDNELSGGTSNDVVVGFGSNNVLKGDKGVDTVVGFGGAGNFVSGGTSAPDTCVGCAGGAVCDATCEVMI